MEQVLKWCVNIPCTLELSISQWIMVFGFHFVAFSAQSPNGPQCDVCGQLTQEIKKPVADVFLKIISPSIQCTLGSFI